MPTQNLLLVHLVATLMMAGVIWVIQLVHYPLFEQVGIDQMQSYAQSHSRRITWIVFPLMLAELACAVFILSRFRSTEFFMLALFGLALVGIIWLSTALIQVPLHNKLVQGGYDLETIRSLVKGNWIRTISWTLRVPIALWLLVRH